MGFGKIVLINQAANYLTIGLANAFAGKYDEVALITGSVHIQGEELREEIKVVKIKRWRERHGFGKFLIYLTGLVQIYFYLLTRFRKHEVFFVSLPPMAYLLNLLLRRKFSMLIWDVYPDAFKVAGMKESHFLYRIWARLNKKSFAKAYRLFTIGERIAGTLGQYVNTDKIIITPIWSIFKPGEKKPKENNPFIRQHNLVGKFIVQYSGNIGLSHRVELLVELAEIMRENTEIYFQIIGRGPRVPYLKELVAARQLDNCHFLPFQSDEMFPWSLSAADIGVVILDGENAHGSVPSKSYNLMSFGIPSLYIAPEDSELQAYARKYGHAACFQSSQLHAAAEFILKLSQDQQLYDEYAKNSLAAARNYTRANADLLVDKYINPKNQTQAGYATAIA